MGGPFRLEVEGLNVGSYLPGSCEGQSITSLVEDTWIQCMSPSILPKSCIKQEARTRHYVLKADVHPIICMVFIVPTLDHFLSFPSVKGEGGWGSFRPVNENFRSRSCTTLFLLDKCLHTDGILETLVMMDN